MTEEDRIDLVEVLRTRKLDRYEIQGIVQWTEPFFKDLCKCIVKPDGVDQRIAVCEAFVARDGVIYGITAKHAVESVGICDLQCACEVCGMMGITERFEVDHLVYPKDPEFAVEEEENDIILLKMAAGANPERVKHISARTFDGISRIEQREQLKDHHRDPRLLVNGKIVEYASHAEGPRFDKGRNICFTTVGDK